MFLDFAKLTEIACFFYSTELKQSHEVEKSSTLWASEAKIKNNKNIIIRRKRLLLPGGCRHFWEEITVELTLKDMEH